MRTWMGAALLAATVSLGGALSAPALAAPEAGQKAAPQNKTKTTDFSAQRRHHHFHHRHHHFGHRGFHGPRFGFGPSYGYGPRYGYGYRPHYRSYYGPAYYGRPYAYRPAYYGGGYGYQPYGYGGGYRPYGAYGYGPGVGFGGGPLSVGFSFGRW